MIPIVIAIIATLVIVAPITWFISSNAINKRNDATIGNANEKAREIIDEALKTAETKKKEALLEVKEESLKTKNELEKETKERRAEISKYEKRVLSKEETLDRKIEAVEKRDSNITRKEEELGKQKQKVEELEKKRQQELERISGLTSEQAKEYLLKTVEDEVKHDTAVMIKTLESRAKEEADKKAKEIVVNAIQRCAADHVAETTISAQKEVETLIKEEGEAATLEVGVHGIHPELVRLLGKLRFRTSYGQNVLKHSIEVAQLTGLLAGELGLDVKMAKRAGLLHDIGKAVDHEMEGSHIQLGVDLCRRYKESALVINAVEAHHGDVEPESLIACLVQAADTISAARPGARRETLETYTNRLKQLEDITNSFKGVEKSFAIQAGREVRVMVVPEVVSDSDMVIMARDISKQIEDQMEYPGQIKVSIVRESRAVDYAK